MINIAIGKYREWLEPDGLLLLEAWARDGLTDEQISKNMGITSRSLTEYKKNYLPIFLALKRGKEVVDHEVENASLKRALGYTVKETITTGEPVIVDGKQQLKNSKVKIIEKHIAPDVGAQIFWLKNRKVEEWRDKKEYVPELVERMESKLTLEELRTIAEHLAKGE